VAGHYDGLLDGFVLDRVDTEQEESIQANGVKTLATDTWMRVQVDRRRLAREVLEFGQRLLSK